MLSGNRNRSEAMAWKKLSVTADEQTNWLLAKRTKFFVDESLGPEATSFLREKKLNVKDVFEEGLIGRPDEDVMAFAWRNKRVLLTHDRDFLDNQRFPEHRNPGVIVLPGGAGDQSAMGHGIARVISVFSKDPEAWRHKKIVVTTDEIQIRGPGPMTQRFRLAKDGRVFVRED
jgi:predicted nuclease of predicted toxin-antitoxin system